MLHDAASDEAFTSPTSRSLAGSHLEQTMSLKTSPRFCGHITSTAGFSKPDSGCPELGQPLVPLQTDSQASASADRVECSFVADAARAVSPLLSGSADAKEKPGISA